LGILILFLKLQCMKLLIVQFCPASCYLLLNPDTSVNGLFSNTFLRMSDKVSHPLKITGKVICNLLSINSNCWLLNSKIWCPFSLT
jgi:hypothetical protein